MEKHEVAAGGMIPATPEFVLAVLTGDESRVRSFAARFADTYSGDDAERVCKEVRDLLTANPTGLRPLRHPERLPVDSKSRFPLLDKQDWPVDPLLLEPNAAAELSRICEEITSAVALNQAGLGVRNALLLSGPPGVGKSHLAGHLAQKLGRPLQVVRLDTIISSLLGDTAKNIRGIFEFARDSGAVLFIDELDTVAKMRDDRKELGELKRVVNALIQGMDILDEHAVIVAATNHPQLLDPAIWRRFPYLLKLAFPTEATREALWQHYLFGDQPDESVRPLAVISEGLTGADIRELSYASRRRAIVRATTLNLASLVSAVLQSETGKLTRPTGSDPVNIPAILETLDNEFGLEKADLQKLGF